MEEKNFATKNRANKYYMRQQYEKLQQAAAPSKEKADEQNGAMLASKDNSDNDIEASTLNIHDDLDSSLTLPLHFPASFSESCYIHWNTFTE